MSISSSSIEFLPYLQEAYGEDSVRHEFNANIVTTQPIIIEKIHLNLGRFEIKVSPDRPIYDWGGNYDIYPLEPKTNMVWGRRIVGHPHIRCHLTSHHIRRSDTYCFNLPFIDYPRFATFYGVGICFGSNDWLNSTVDIFDFIDGITNLLTTYSIEGQMGFHILGKSDCQACYLCRAFHSIQSMSECKQCKGIICKKHLEVCTKCKHKFCQPHIPTHGCL